MGKKVFIFFTAFLFQLTLDSAAQPYRGGISDGQSGVNAGTFNLTVSSGVYKGGVSDGLAIAAPGTFNLSASGALYKGGAGDGDAQINAGTVNLIISSSLYKGGIDDGYATTTGFFNLSSSSALYKGGTHKGDNQVNTPGVNLSICTDTIVWNGNYDINWDNPANWDCGKVPDVNSIVLVPSAKPRYPAIRFNTQIKLLDIKAGASVILNSGKLLLINGH